MFGWLKDLFGGSSGPVLSGKSLPLDVIKQQARLLFIDDQSVSLVALLQSEGWHVEHWTDVKSLRDLENGAFSLVFLDIKGIGKSYSPDKEGFGLIERLKQRNPSLLIVAYSGESFDAEKTSFFQKADAQLNKSSGGLKAIDLVENLLSQRWKADKVWEDLQKILIAAKVPESNVMQIQKLVFSENAKQLDDKQILSQVIDTTKLSIEVVSLSYRLLGLLRLFSAG